MQLGVVRLVAATELSSAATIVRGDRQGAWMSTFDRSCQGSHEYKIDHVAVLLGRERPWAVYRPNRSRLSMKARLARGPMNWGVSPFSGLGMAVRQTIRAPQVLQGPGPVGDNTRGCLHGMETLNRYNSVESVVPSKMNEPSDGTVAIDH